MIRLLAIILVMAFAQLTSAEWTQFLGPDRNGLVTGQNLPAKFPEGGPRLKWTIDVGEGFGGAAIADGRVYMLDREADQHDVLRCVSLTSGQEIWRQSYEVEGKLSYPGSRSTPTVGEKYIFTCGSFGHVTCFDRESGKIVWQLDMREAFNSPVPNWGFAQSPLLRGDKVIVAAMAEDVGLVALDQATGKVAWKSEGVGGNTYISTRVYKMGGIEQIVFGSTSGVSSIHADTGVKLWSFDGYQNRIPIPAAAQVDDNRLFLTGGYGAGSVMVRAEPQGDKWTVTELWRTDHGTQIHPAVVFKGHIYMNGNTNETLRGGGKNAPGMICFDLEGKIVWQTDNMPDVGRGGMIVADGKAYTLAGQSGYLHLVNLTSEAYDEHDAAKVIEGDRGNTNHWGPMSLSSGYLILRDQKQVKCFDLLPARQANAKP